MKILMLSWEYPPKNVGGLSAHLYNLSQELVKIGHEIHVITSKDGIEAPSYEIDKGVHVHRVNAYNIYTEDFTKWVMHLNFAMTEEGVRLINYMGNFDIIHAHDWLSAYSARTLKLAYGIPLVATIHATEYGRNRGIHNEMQKYISSVEWMLTYESWKVVACSGYMKEEIHNIFEVPQEKIWVISNGVEIRDVQEDFDKLSFRRKYVNDNEKIILYVGRHVFEKGIHLLVEAAPELITRYNDVKFIIVGTGQMTEEIKQKVGDMGLYDKFLFTGFIDDESKNNLYRTADVAVVPSLYEPFGIAALEAMSAGCPVVVSDVGGLHEIIQHRENGLTMIPNSPHSLADNIAELLFNDELVNSIRINAIKTVQEKYSWNKIAKLTSEMYNAVKMEEAKAES